MIRRWKNIGFSTRTAIFMVVPMVLVILVSGYYLTADQIADTERNADQRGRLLVRHFSSIVELGMVAQDKAVLASYADIMLNEEGVVSVLMHDIDNNVLLEKDVEELENEHKHIKYFSAPVLLSGVTVGGIEGETDATGYAEDSKPIGKVRVGILSVRSHLNQDKILLVGLLGTFIAIIISTFFGYGVSRAITRPILRLNNTVGLLTTGRLSTRVMEGSEGEIGALERGINNMAESLQEAQSDLLDRVDKATSELNTTVSELEKRNIELEKSRRQAEELGEEKAQFLARMSHELRTPLNAVIGFSRLMKKNINEQDRQEYTRTIINSATQLSSVIDDVLTFSKLKSGSLSLSQEKFSPQTVCEDTVVMLSALTREKNIELVLLIDKNVPDTIDGDELRVSQVLTNLVNNAIKFTDTGDVIVSVLCQPASSGDQLMITVTDTGCGISPGNIDKLFNEFSQLENTLTRQSEGVGLGLSISRHLAREMGGDVTVNSEKNRGSCFSFSIPLLNPTCEQQPELPVNKLIGKNVLLFEVHPESRRSLQSMLQRFGMNLFVAKNKADATKRLVKTNVVKPPDILILALSAEQIKTVNCHEMTDEFTASFDGPVLILTGTSQWELPVNMPKQKHLLCASKPLRQKTLYRYITSLLQVGDKTEGLCNEQNEYSIKSWMDGKNVLVVEDNSFNQTLIRIMLEQRSLQVKVVDNANDAIAAARDEKFSLILMDLHMPGCDGISVARTIRQGGFYSSDTPIVLVTADVLFDEQPLIDEAVINQILHKPIHERALDRVLKNCLGDKTNKKTSRGEEMFKDADINKTVQKLTGPLQQEILRLCSVINDSLEREQTNDAEEYVHQLAGLSGYNQLDEISQAVISLQKLIKSNNWKASLKQLGEIKKSVTK